jgi:hypothetical protein
MGADDDEHRVDAFRRIVQNNLFVAVRADATRTSLAVGWSPCAILKLSSRSLTLHTVMVHAVHNRVLNDLHL